VQQHAHIGKHMVMPYVVECTSRGQIKIELQSNCSCNHCLNWPSLTAMHQTADSFSCNWCILCLWIL